MAWWPASFIAIYWLYSVRFGKYLFILHCHKTTAYCYRVCRMDGHYFNFYKNRRTLFFQQRISWIEVFFLLLIMVGILGLKIYAVQVK